MQFLLSVHFPAAVDPWPGEPLEAVFETRADAEAAGDLVLRIYRGQGVRVEVRPIKGGSLSLPV